MSEVSNRPKRPFRFEIDVSIATDDPDQASRLWCSVNDLLETIPGVFPQGGYFGPMPVEEVIAGSPLDEYLHDACGCEKCHPEIHNSV